MNDSRFLALSLDTPKLKTTIKLTIAVNKKIPNVDESTAKLLELVLHREQDQCCTALSISSPTTAPFPIPYPFEQEDE